MIEPAYPDYDLMRELVERALEPPAPSRNGDDSAGAAPSTSATPSDPAENPTPDDEENPADDVRDACAYDPQQAQEALEEGEPPSLNG